MLFVREDYYQLLDAQPTATRRELRAAYRRVAKLYHPDLNGGSPAAEERFKLIAEAWRTLGNEEKRRDYDDWLSRHRRYASMPEMENLQRRNRSRVSSRRMRGERPSERQRAAAGAARWSFRARPFLIRPRGSKVSGMAYALISLCFVVSMLPYLQHHMEAAERVTPQPSAADDAPQLGYGESPLPEAEQQRILKDYIQRLAARAEQGDPVSQYRYAFILYMGVGGVPQDKAAARRWWEIAAANGNLLAREMINTLNKNAEPQQPENAPAE